MSNTPTPSYHGKLLSLEGGDGSGKSTFLPFLKQAIEEQGYTVQTFREPGGTAFAEDIRTLFLDNSALSPTTSAYLMNAQRQHNIEHIITPALERGDVVIVDRFVASTLVYQGILKDALNDIRPVVLNYPSQTIFLNTPPLLARQRIVANNRETNHFDDMPLDKHQAIYDGYLSLSDLYPNGYWHYTVDGSTDIAGLKAQAKTIAKTFASTDNKS